MNGGDPHIMVLMILSVVCMAAAVILAYIPRWPAVVAAYAAMLLGHFSGYSHMESSTLWFWAVASLMVMGINVLLQQQVSRSRVGVPYFATGALVGAVLGMLLNTSAAIITASAVGVVLAAVAFSRMDAGSRLDFPSKRFFNYLCAKGLPLVVIFSMVGILGIRLISGGSTL